MTQVYIIADDHPLFRDAMQQALEGYDPECSLHTVGDLNGLRGLLREIGSADLVMLDLAMPGTNDFSGLVSIRAEFPDTPVVVVSASEDPGTIRKCIDLGASGFIPKSSGTSFIYDGMTAIQEGGIWVPESVDLDADEASGDDTSELIAKLQSLTPQQTRVLAMLGEGLLNKQIAYELGVSEATVKAHVSAVLLKLGVDSRTQAVIIMNRISGGVLGSTSAH
ncbi:MAG: response regulator transcription factor [Pseudomonadota bacterium]